MLPLIFNTNIAIICSIIQRTLGVPPHTHPTHLPTRRWVVYEKAARGQGRSIALQNATPVSPLAVLCFAGQSLIAGADDVIGEEDAEGDEDVWEGDPADGT